MSPETMIEIGSAALVIGATILVATGKPDEWIAAWRNRGTKIDVLKRQYGKDWEHFKKYYTEDGELKDENAFELKKD